MRARREDELEPQHLEQVEQLVEPQRRFPGLDVVDEHGADAGEPRKLDLRDAERLAPPARAGPAARRFLSIARISMRGANSLPLTSSKSMRTDGRSGTRPAHPDRPREPRDSKLAALASEPEVPDSELARSESGLAVLVSELGDPDSSLEDTEPGVCPLGLDASSDSMRRRERDPKGRTRSLQTGQSDPKSSERSLRPRCPRQRARWRGQQARSPRVRAPSSRERPRYAV